jgi:hypothetical protein
MSDDFTSQIFAFLRQVFADKALHPTAFKLAFAISQYVNRKTRKAWPELPTLASAAGISKRTVIRLIEGLEANGHLPGRAAPSPRPEQVEHLSPQHQKR